MHEPTHVGRGWGAALVLSLALVACDGGGGTTSMADASVPDGGIVLPALPAPAAMPTPPTIAPCPTGWRITMDATTHVPACDPWPASGASETCAWGEAHFPGTPGCARVGTPCAADGWPTGLPTDRTIVYVDDGAAAGGDGSRAAPFRTVTEAVAVAPDGSVIAIATGTYVEPGIITPHAQTTLWGACTDGTRLTTHSVSEMTPFLGMDGSGLGLRNLGIDTPERNAIVVRSGDTTIEDVVIDGALGDALYTGGGHTTVTHVVMRNTRAMSDGSIGDAIWMNGGRATVNALVIDHAREYGFYLSPGSDMTAADVSVRHTQVLMQSGLDGRGVGVEAAHLALSRAVIEDNLEMGLWATMGARVELSDVVVRRTDENIAGDLGLGIMVQSASVATVQRALVEQNHSFGVTATGTFTSLTLSDAIVRDTRIRSMDMRRGQALYVGTAATATLERVVVNGAVDLGVNVTDEGTTATLRDVTLVNVAAAPGMPDLGYGIETQTNAALTLERVRVDHATGAGIIAIAGARIDGTDVTVTQMQPNGSGVAGYCFVSEQATLTLTRAQADHCIGAGVVIVASSGTLTDVAIEAVASRPSDGFFGRGLDVEAGGTTTIARVSIDGAHDDGVFVGSAGTTLTGTDLTIRDTAGVAANGHAGIGLLAQTQAIAHVSHVRVERARMAGVAALDHGALQLDELVVDGVMASECAATTCPELGGGFGVVATGEGTVTAAGFTVTDAAICGAVVGVDANGLAGAMDLSRGTIARAPIGACVQVDGYDVERLHRQVGFVDVAVPLQSTSYAMPDTSAPVMP